MERNNWIENILNSANGIIPVAPSDDLFSKIQQRIQQNNTVQSKTVWLVAASISVLVSINFALLSNEVKEKENTATVYLENTLNKSNQLYK